MEGERREQTERPASALAARDQQPRGRRVGVVIAPRVVYGRRCWINKRGYRVCR
ncbi:hypothetical protein [Chenggangzhangella methanolivorans]|uniref:Uncharacterized protein n=1 Tax=Chenggangzhangella methanolivorans TaxID=1437009 RepID=A0A9E6RA67_9HYPH|nr:hypothetical protein [Chenggangzhangella methanolivorans]QZO01016.1 hypothetical protein K6K41_05285 [Chenggangzhangella methanolivorans]